MIFLFNKVLLLSHVKYCVPGGIISSYEIRHRCFFFAIYNFSILVSRFFAIQVYLPVFPNIMTPNRGT